MTGRAVSHARGTGMHRRYTLGRLVFLPGKRGTILIIRYPHQSHGPSIPSSVRPANAVAPRSPQNDGKCEDQVEQLEFKCPVSLYPK